MAVARSAGIPCRCHADAFAAAADLIAHPHTRTLLLLAIDGLARVEMDICRWAPQRGGSIDVWAHGRVERLNGQAEGQIIHRIRMDRLGQELQSWREGSAVNADMPRRDEVAAVPGPEVVTELDAAEEALVETSENAPHSVEPARSMVDESETLTEEETALLIGDEESPPQPAEQPPLRLHAVAEDDAVLTEEELEALLGSDGEAGHAHG